MAPKAPPVEVIGRIRAYRPSMPQSEVKVASYVLENQAEVLRMSVAELAAASGTSDATVVRFFRRIGYKRWVEFIVALSSSVPMSGELIYDKIQPTDTPGAVSAKVLGGAIDALRATSEVLDPEAIEGCVNAIDSAGHTLIVGVGNSTPMAHELYNQLFRVGIDCTVISDAYLQVMRAVLLGPGDVLCVVSQSGSSQIPLHAVAVAKDKGASVIALTGDMSSPLAQAADHVLLAVAHEVRTDALDSRIAQYALIYSLYVNLAIRRMNQTISNEREIWKVMTSIPGL